MMDQLPMLYETSPLFETLLQGIHSDGISVTDISQLKPLTVEYQFLSFSGDWGLAALDIPDLEEEMSED